MAQNLDSPSWIVYKHYFQTRSEGKTPKHLYDGYSDKSITVKNGGPFKNPIIDSAKNDDVVSEQSMTSKFPGVKMISPNKANLDKALSSLKQRQIAEQTINGASDNLPIDETDKIPSSQPGEFQDKLISQAELKTPKLKLGKRHTKLSLGEIREKLLDSPGWRKRTKMNN